jgi:hypothetical protein
MRRTLSLTVLLAPTAASAAPDTLTYSGRLLDTLGDPVHGAHDLTVRLWPAAGPAVFEQTFDDVGFADGYFTVEIGASLSAEDLLAGPLDVGLALDGAAELPLRTPLTSVPYARLAEGVRLHDVGTACVTALEGTLRLHAGVIEVCMSDTWVRVGGAPNGTQTSPATSCRSLHNDWPDLPSQAYWIDPNAGAATDAFEAYCDMSTEGGGWTRVGTIDGQTYVCSLQNVLGTKANVAGSAGTAWWAASEVTPLFVDREVLLTTPGAYTRYRSSNPAFTWASIADGTIGTSNVNAYNVEYKRHTMSAFAVLPLGGCNAVSGADCLLGGHDGSWTHMLGIGSHNAAGTHDQVACQTAIGSAWRGMLYGAAWDRAGEVYIR